MTARTLNLDDALYQYLLDVSLRETPLLKRLRDETQALPMARWQVAPEQGQFLALLVRLIGARRILEIGTFTGYSALEDVHLSARIAKTHRVYFHKTAMCIHRDATSIFKRDSARLVGSRLQHQELVAREVMGRGGLSLRWKMLLHRIFTSIHLLRRRRPGWGAALRGVWN